MSVHLEALRSSILKQIVKTVCKFENSKYMYSRGRLLIFDWGGGCKNAARLDIHSSGHARWSPWGEFATSFSHLLTEGKEMAGWFKFLSANNLAPVPVSSVCNGWSVINLPRYLTSDASVGAQTSSIED
jgi:hypothetical protein